MTVGIIPSYPVAYADVSALARDAAAPVVVEAPAAPVETAVEAAAVETEVVADDDSNIPTFVASEEAEQSDGDESGKDK